MRAFAAVLLMAGMAGCAAVSPPPQPFWTDAQSAPRRSLVSTVPFVPQTDHYCGPAALTMVLRASGLAVDLKEVERAVYTPGREGTLRNDMVAGARRWQRLAVPLERPGDLIREIAAGNPVVVFQNLSLESAPQWHFAVALGYDLDNENVVLHSGTSPYYQTALATFQRTWQRGDYWGLVVTAPGRIPETASERSALEAAAALERQGPAAAVSATAAYKAITARWPHSFGAAMGLGNVYYAARQFDRAEVAYRNALGIRPDAPEAWNNLAYALLDKGDRQEALSAARMAVRYGADRKEAYQRTLDEIQARARGPG